MRNRGIAHVLRVEEADLAEECFAGLGSRRVGISTGARQGARNSLTRSGVRTVEGPM
jgi:hypothetical protein